MTTAKEKIRQCVAHYMKTHAAEFAAYKQSLAVQKDTLVDSKFAQVKNTDFLLRKLTEYPENLFFLIQNALTEDEKEWWRTKEGGRWFAKSFKQFSVADKI